MPAGSSPGGHPIPSPIRHRRTGADTRSSGCDAESTHGHPGTAHRAASVGWLRRVADRWRTPTGGRSFAVEDPATGRTPRRVADGTAADGVAALDAAAGAQATWAATAPRLRAEILRTAYDLLTARTEQFALLMTLEMGKPLAQAARHRVTSLVAQATDRGATVLTGGSPVGDLGYFYRPTVLTDVPADAELTAEEIFGPVAPVTTFTTEDEALHRANDTAYGLAAYVFTRDLSRAVRVSERLDVGMVGVNQGIVSNPAAPFGGVKQSGYGREGGPEGIEEYLPSGASVSRPEHRRQPAGVPGIFGRGGWQKGLRVGRALWLAGPMETSTGTGDSVEAYFVCGTPRTGSSLLLGLLESTGVAGRPQAYFRAPDEPAWAERWGIARTDRGGFDYADYVRAALAAGRTDNGVFGAKLMWGTLDEVVDKLGVVHPDLAGDDLALLHRTFGRTRFVFVRRDDVVAQAVSWLRAEQTGTWYLGGNGEISGGGGTGRTPVFDAEAVHRFVEVIGEHNAAWESWFAAVGAQPHVVRYEELDDDSGAVVAGVLAFLGLALLPGRVVTPYHRRQADELNRRWIARYRAWAADHRPAR
ncbi:aldehyde dehydrogenase family protein [Micromonospora echinofusca]|uniref:aldehyde dehydrogenase family protein n=1 Tax=Micromonospora echinofusca TaxID=47858 RepID=UPI00244E397F|nr:aldehyde dehydrogenase family protein [Micromonospora echinofusca]